MSHSRERAEKICLNCNTQLNGRFCHVCGQENTDPRESIWSVIVHFFNDITHFDGKFFKTVGLLIAKPGFLPREYINGRRARYLHPIRLYIFTSAVFFLIFYSFFTIDISSMISAEVEEGETPTPGQVMFNPIDTILTVNDRENPYRSVAEYDSVQQTLPKQKRDGWLTSLLTKSFIEKRIKYGGKNESMSRSVVDNFIHSFPYLLFVSLPICALFLQMLFYKNKNNIYAGNAIFLVYLYVFTFLMMIIYFLNNSIRNKYHIGWLGWLNVVILLYVAYYAFKAMRTYYGQGRFSTIVKFVVYNVLALATMIFLFIIFLFFSAIKA